MTTTTTEVERAERYGITYDQLVKIAAEAIREAAEEFVSLAVAGDPDCLFPEVWLHKYADRLEGLA